MSWLATGLGGRAAAIAGSLAAHAALVAVGGHGAGRADVPGAARAQEMAMELVEAPALLTPPPVTEVTAVARAAPVHTHTHPYAVPAGHDLHPHDPSLVHLADPRSPPVRNEPSTPADAPAVVAAAAPVARFTMVLGQGAVSYGAASIAGAAPGGDAAAEDAPVPAASVTVPAHLMDRPAVAYPDEARRAGVEGEVPVEIVVDARGAVIDARVLRHAGYGLDEAALDGVRRYRFTPAQKDGRAVRVRMTWPVQFRLE